VGAVIGPLQCSLACSIPVNWLGQTALSAQIQSHGGRVATELSLSMNDVDMTFLISAFFKRHG
jgi:hypothetical protein